MTTLLPVILSGGAGTRLWPVSRETHPKPFMRLADGESLLQKTFRRAAALASAGEIITVTNREHYFQTKDTYADCAGASAIASSFLLEPLGRNTAPAIALAALRAAAAHGDGVILLILPADHLISDQAAFAAAVASASQLAAGGELVTFGITPQAPETGFGYIEAGEALAGGGRRARRFVEKPAAATAAAYLAAGNFYWNSGMFCFRAGALLDAMAQTCPAVLDAARACWAASTATSAGAAPLPAMLELERTSFAQQPNISIDYALMEKAPAVALLPCDIGWSDIGSWNALSDLAPQDENGNGCIGEVLLVDSRNTFVQGEHHLVAAVGVDDLIIVDTPDATLVAHKDSAQQVREVVTRLKAQGHSACRLHSTVFRPWGSYTVLEEGPRFKIKRIVVRPGASLSLQMHHHRSEHWVVVAGMARVVNGESEIYVSTNQSTYIPAGNRHRLENPGVIDCVMIEVQTGDYVGEDDIVRFEDIYGRTAG